MKDWRNENFTLKAIGFIVLFAIFLVFNPNKYDREAIQEVYADMWFDVKVEDVKHRGDSRDTHYYGKSSTGRDTSCAVPPAWGNAIAVIDIGDSVKKEKGKNEIKVVRKSRTMYFPMILEKNDTVRDE